MSGTHDTNMGEYSLKCKKKILNYPQNFDKYGTLDPKICQPAREMFLSMGEVHIQRRETIKFSRRIYTCDSGDQTPVDHVQCPHML